MKEKNLVRQQNKSNDKYYQLHQSGLRLVEEGKYIEAIKLFMASIALNPDFVWSYYDLGITQLKLNQFQEAIQSFSKAIVLKPDYVWTYCYLGDACLKCCNYQQAIKSLEKAIELKPDYAWSYQEMGIAQMNTGNYPAAIDAFKKAIKYEPGNGRSCFLSGIIYQKSGNFRKAIDCFQKAIVLNPGNATYYRELGVTYYKSKRITEALGALKTAIKIDPDFVWTYYDYGKILTATHRFDAAIEAYEKAISLKPDYTDFYNDLGDILSKVGQIHRAKESYRNALKNELKQDSIYLLNSVRPPEPHFMIIGFAKCGTTSLYEFLIQHPQLLPAAKKEIMYFSENFHYKIDWYQSHLPAIPGKAHKLTGEASAHYIDHPKAYKRIHQLYPNLKFIVLLRDPIKRAYSDYQMWKREGKEQRTFKQVMKTEMKRVKGEAQSTFNEKFGWRYPSYLTSSLYVYSLKRWLTLFRREQFLILQIEKFNLNPQKGLNQIFQFLGLDAFTTERFPKRNVGNYLPMCPEIHTALREYFRPHNELLEAFLRIKFDWHQKSKC